MLLVARLTLTVVMLNVKLVVCSLCALTQKLTADCFPHAWSLTHASHWVSSGAVQKPPLALIGSSRLMLRGIPTPSSTGLQAERLHLVSYLLIKLTYGVFLYSKSWSTSAEGHQRNPELENLAELSGYHRQLQHRPQTSAPIRYNRERTGPQQAYFQSYHDPQSQFSRSSHQGGEDIGGYLSYLSMASGPTCRAEQEQEKRVCQDETEEPEGVKTEGLLRSRKAVLPSEIRRRERSMEDPQRGRSEEEMGLSSMYSLSQAQVAAVEEHARSGVIGRARTEKSEHSTCLQAAEWRPRGQQNVIYVHKEPTATHIHPNTLHAIHGTTASRTAFNPLVSDVGTNQRNIQHQLQDYRVQEFEGDGNGEGHQDRRVSVAKLRHSYMESTTTPPSRRRNELYVEKLNVTSMLLTG
ncbi:hypothetical protein XENOCAPTIV_021196 [Xenoophorus captivus]|uniref:Uncharacterized protein n=1 Tax=Xenoophorus captivus TaxID=1517983 RepID=A0ABV0QEW0_9TELE